MPILNKWECFSTFNYNSRGFCRAKNENFERGLKGEEGVFITLQMKGWAPSPFCLPKGLVPWTVATKPSEVNGGERCHFAPHLLKPLERLFHFRLNFFFWLARVATWPLALVGKIPYAHSYHLLFFSWPLSELPLICRCLTFACLIWLFLT